MKLKDSTDPATLMPREKAMALGIKALTDKELMAIIFSTGTQGKSVLELCADILAAKSNHLSLVARMDWRQFTQEFKGIGPAKALTLLAALELGARAGRDALSMGDMAMSSSRKVYEYMLPEMINLDHEEFWILLLDNANKPIRHTRISQGGMNATMADVRIILREAILSKAIGMIVLHNHPSGALTASPQDISLTRKIKEAADTLNIRLLDHIIVTDSDFYSFNDNGRMP